MNHHRTVSFVVVLAVALLWAPLLPAGIVISPGSTTVSPVQTFTVPVSITGASDVFAFQFDLAFDPSILSLLSISEGSFLPSAGNTIFSPGAIDNVAGTAMGTLDSLTGQIPGASGNGVLADFNFEAIQTGTSALALSGVILLDSNLTEIPFATVDGSVTVSPGSTVPEPPGLSWIACLAVAGMFASKRWHRTGPGTART